MGNKDGFCFPPNSFSCTVHRNIEVFRIHIRQEGAGPDRLDGMKKGRTGKTRKNDLITRSNSQGMQ